MNSLPAKAGAFIRLSRPVFLAGPALLYGLGAAVARTEDIDWGAYALGQAMVTAVQLTTQYANEYHDEDTDALARRTWFTGGSGVLAAGELAPQVARRAALASTAASLLLIGGVAFVDGRVAVVGLAALAGGWLYSAPPVRLAGTVAGVTVASVIVAFLTPLVGALLQDGEVSSRLLAVTVPLVLLHHAMLLAFERPDENADRQTGKRTLTVQFGRAAVARAHNTLIAAVFASLGAFWAAGTLSFSEVGWALAQAPLAIWQTVAINRADDHTLTLGAVALFAFVTSALLFGQL